MSADESEVQFINARLPIWVVSFGMLISVNEVQPSNAELPIVVRSAQIVIDSSVVQFLKAAASISVTSFPPSFRGISTTVPSP